MRVITGDCLEIMRSLPDASVDAIVTDPPYGLGFMGAAWDHEVPGPVVWAEALRVIKPGGYLAAFGGTRKYHRMTVAIEDAAWEIRDCLSWLYGQGFPKAGDVGKAIDKAAGAERPVVGPSRHNVAARSRYGAPDHENDHGRYGVVVHAPETAPATPEAERWDGWAAALKPAWEPIVLARRALDGTLVENVLRHGTGAMNIDACRIGESKEVPASMSRHRDDICYGVQSQDPTSPGFDPNVGQYPANLVLDEAAAAMLDEQAGARRSGGMAVGQPRGPNAVFGKMTASGSPRAFPAITGAASRFFYCAKATRRERQLGGVDNRHPTVKPVRLMRWLVRLLCPPGGVVLDPFAGSGTTGVACALEGLDFVGIEIDPTHAETARRRIAAAGAEVDEEDERVEVPMTRQGSLF